MKKRQARKIIKAWMAGRPSSSWKHWTFRRAFRWCYAHNRQSIAIRGGQFKLKAGATIKAGQMVAVNAEGRAVPAMRSVVCTGLVFV